jgi:DNA invertase Pin-like site-specific DNA recombinase
MATGKFISYLRVSTAKQGQSGLGLEAQRQAVTDFLNGGCWQLLREYVEVETGKRADRPVLSEALHHCKVTGATLVIAKLDRLSRDLEFIARMQKGAVRFLCCDMPETNELTVHLLAAIAQHERQAISKRTREALAAAKARGTWVSRSNRTVSRLGNPNGAAAIRRAGKGNAAAVVAIKAAADEHAANLAPIIDDIRGNGITSYKAIARELNNREILTARGGRWYPTTVKNLLTRHA